MTQLLKETEKNGDTNKSERTNKMYKNGKVYSPNNGTTHYGVYEVTNKIQQ